MRLTIVKPDNLMIIDQEPVTIDLTAFSLPEHFHALQWYGNRGELEFDDGSPNQPIDNITAYQPLIDRYAELKKQAENPPPLPEAEQYKLLVSQRNSYLNQTDWLILRQQEQQQTNSSTVTVSDFPDILRWRQQLRDLPQQYTSSAAWRWPEPPASISRIIDHPPKN